MGFIIGPPISEIHIRPPVLSGIESRSHNLRITICVTPMEMESHAIWAEQKILNSQSPRPGPCRDHPCGLRFRNGLKYPEFPLKAKKKLKMSIYFCGNHASNTISTM